MRLDEKEVFNTYKITPNFQLFNKAKKKFEPTKLNIVKILLVGDGYEKCYTMAEYRSAFLALQSPLRDEEETLVKRYVEKRWKKK